MNSKAKYFIYNHLGENCICRVTNLANDIIEGEILFTLCHLHEAIDSDLHTLKISSTHNIFKVTINVEDLKSHMIQYKESILRELHIINENLTNLIYKVDSMFYFNKIHKTEDFFVEKNRKLMEFQMLNLQEWSKAHWLLDLKNNWLDLITFVIKDKVLLKLIK